MTAGSYEDDDALSSKRARLVVRVPPQDPRIFHDGVALGPSVSPWKSRYPVQSHPLNGPMVQLG